jgi:hypothetical protein
VVVAVVELTHLDVQQHQRVVQAAAAMAAVVVVVAQALQIQVAVAVEPTSEPPGLAAPVL